MISYLKGKNIQIGGDYVVIDVNDVGYQVFVIDVSRCKINSTISFWIHEHIREDRHELYGFFSPAELNFFIELISVNGVGPKMARTIMSKNSIDKLQAAIIQGDIKLLTAVGGVGKKIAGKIIIELKNKLSSNDTINFSDESTEEVLDALKQLGYKEQELIPFLSKMPEDLVTTQNKIKWILKHIKN